jgi:glutathione S-transferase
VKLELYYAPITCSLVPYIALTEAGAPFEVRALDFRRSDHLSDDYLRINPRHKVPALLIDGEPLTENMAILLWIARQFPQARLLPDGAAEFQAIALMAWCDSGIHPTLTPNVLPQRYCDLPGSEDSVRRCAQRLMLENFKIAEQMLCQRDWFFDHFTLPDIFFFWCFRRGIQFNVDLSAFRWCRAHFERTSKRTSVAQLVAFEATVMADFDRHAASGHG